MLNFGHSVPLCWAGLQSQLFRVAIGFFLNIQINSIERILREKIELSVKLHCNGSDKWGKWGTSVPPSVFISCCDLPCFICGSVHFHCNLLYLVARRGRFYVVEDNQCGWGPGSDNWYDMAGCWILIFTNIHRTAFPAPISKEWGWLWWWWWWQWPTQDVWHEFLQCHHCPFVQLSGFFATLREKEITFNLVAVVVCRCFVCFALVLLVATS